uniref:CobQ/CobB/MinD/ParA nucleotide binding domain-containing protein n=1 Tax=Candidatus Kentrum sp. DK TaxID=2126562 RepID=A0A450SXR9_9GAMM|nr:MAG: CobQ/CobB/MinD/ParA nucleotide binding domain-containing protein [Candidatus Kentron sp. DK]
MNAKHAWVFTFFAFKGGTGRTSALANVARYLAEERGYRVGLIDLDMEAPGLPMQPLFDIGARERNNPGNEDDPRSPWQRWRGDVVDRCPGFADLFIEMAKDPRSWPGEEESPWQFEETTWERLPRYVIPCPSQGGGQIMLMPAAMGSVTRTDDFRAHVREFLHRTSGPNNGILENGEEMPDPALLTSRILGAFIDIYKLDYLFLDGRTGMGGFTPVFLYSVPHALVLFLGLNDQNIDGSLGVFDEMLPPESGQGIIPAPVITVLTPVPTSGMEQLEERLDEVRKRLQHKRGNRERQGGNYIFRIPDSVRIHLPYVDKIAYTESYVPVEYPNHALSGAYREIADQIEAIVAYQGSPDADKKSSIGDLKDRLAEQGKDAPLVLAVEDINHEHLERFFTRLDFEQTEEVKKSDEYAICRYKSRHRSEECHIELRLYSATGKEAPWSRLDSPPDADIVAVPYSSLHRLDNERYWNLDERHQYWRRSDVQSAPLPKIYDHRYLDEWYPDWRHISSRNGTVWGMPFSVTTTFLLGNKELLIKDCANYWKKIGKNHGELAHPYEPEEFFIPSNFDLLLDLIESQPETQEEHSCFRVALEGRAAYYEWLNVVLSYGLYDIRVVDGGSPQILPEERMGELVEPTLTFLRLADQTCRVKKAENKKNSEKALENYSMSDLTEDFRKGQVSLYMGWSDSMVFKDEGEEKRTLSLPDNESIEPVIGRFPRDIRYPRRPLVDGWVLCFPKKGNGPGDLERLKAAEYLVGAMLESEFQALMLKNGFPSYSRTLLKRELERLGFGEHSDYAAFLHTLMDSVKNGHWVPPHDKSREMMERWSGQLRRWLARIDEAFDFNDETFHREIKSELNQLLHPLSIT